MQVAKRVEVAPTVKGLDETTEAECKSPVVARVMATVADPPVRAVVQLVTKLVTMEWAGMGG